MIHKLWVEMTLDNHLKEIFFSRSGPAADLRSITDPWEATRDKFRVRWTPPSGGTSPRGETATDVFAIPSSRALYGRRLRRRSVLSRPGSGHLGTPYLRGRSATNVEPPRAAAEGACHRC